MNHGGPVSNEVLAERLESVQRSLTQHIAVATDGIKAEVTALGRTVREQNSRVGKLETAEIVRREKESYNKGASDQKQANFTSLDRLFVRLIAVGGAGGAILQVYKAMS